MTLIERNIKKNQITTVPSTPSTLPPLITLIKRNKKKEPNRHGTTTCIARKCQDLSVVPIMGSLPPLTLASRHGSVSTPSVQGSVRRCQVPWRTTTRQEGRSTPHTMRVSFWRPHGSGLVGRRAAAAGRQGHNEPQRRADKAHSDGLCRAGEKHSDAICGRADRQAMKQCERCGSWPAVRGRSQEPP